MPNSIIISGRLTKTPELRSTQSGTAVTSFTVAVDRDYTGGGEKQTDFIDCVAWRQTAEFVSRYFSKGKMIIVQGSLQSRKWQDREGNNRISWEVQASGVWFGGDKPRDNNHDVPLEDSNRDGQSPYFDGQSGATFTELPDDDLPF